MISNIENVYLPHKAVITRIIPQTEDTKLFEFKLEDTEIRNNFTFDPGQFIQLSIFGMGEAPFSISSSPYNRGFIQLCVRNVGNVTNALHQMKPTDIVGIRGPYGKGFPYEEIKGMNVLIVAGGLGLVPLRSLINNILADRNDFGRVIIFCGTRTPEDLLFKDELKLLEKRDDIELLLTVDRGSEDWKGNIGVVTTLFDKIDVSAENTAAIVCGPPVMYKFVVKKLLDLKFRKNKIWLSLERKMRCGVGKCGHCGIGYKYTCLDGPVFSYWEVENLREAI